MGLISFGAHSGTRCGVKLNLQDVNWTGECKGGYADGLGLLSYKYRDNDNRLNSQDTFGMIKDGELTGLQLVTSDMDNPIYRFVKFYANGETVAVGPTIVTGVDNKHLPLNQRLWADVNAVPDKNGNQLPISYLEAINKIKAYISQRNEPSIDFEIFKAYLEGRVRVIGEDDPPVLGVALKPSGGKRKKT